MISKKLLLFLLISFCYNVNAMKDNFTEGFGGVELYNALSEKLECYFSEAKIESEELLEGFDAFQSQIITMFEHYINGGGNINYIKEKSGYSLLSLCSYVGMDKVVKYMVEKKGTNMNLTTDNGPPLFTACMQTYSELKENYLKIISLLLNHKDIRVDVTDSEGNSPLHAAYMFNFQEAVDLLIKAGAHEELQNEHFVIPCDMNT
jgi:ankyrin repeat protein